MKKQIALAVILASALVLSGCSGLMKSSAPPPTLYPLHAAAQAPRQAKAQRVVSVAEPQVPPGFDSDRIAIYLEQSRRMDFAAGAAWPAPLPKVLQDFIVHSAAANPRLMAVLPDSGLPAAYSLMVRVNDFEPVYGADAKAAPVLKASMTFSLVALDRNKIIANFTESRETPATANSLTAITAGLETLAQDMVSQAWQKMLLSNIHKKSTRRPERHLTPGMNISSKDIWQ